MQTNDPFEMFAEIYDTAMSLEIGEPNAMNLATVDADGRPSSRMVLLKDFDRNGFVFYTNLRSRKAEQIRTNANVALCFYWSPIATQIRIEGRAEQVDDATADGYFATRERMSKIGAWASKQSDELSGRAEFERAVEEVEHRFDGVEIPRPPFWSGFLVVATKFEFWFGRAHRLHDRHQFTSQPDGTWREVLLYP